MLPYEKPDDNAVENTIDNAVDAETSAPTTDQPEQVQPAAQRPRVMPRNRIWRDIIEIVLLIAITYTPINLMTARAIVEGSSMQPNFATGQLLIVNRLAYFFNAPQRGDVVVLHNPRNANDDDLIKRVIGLPGETVELREGRIYINGTLIEEPYIKDFCNSCRNETWVLNADEYFILGDNRNNSYDSHSFGPISRKLIVGQAWIRYWPVQEFKVFVHPEYGTIPTAQATESRTEAP